MITDNELVATLKQAATGDMDYRFQAAARIEEYQALITTIARAFESMPQEQAAFRVAMAVAFFIGSERFNWRDQKRREREMSDEEKADQKWNSL